MIIMIGAFIVGAGAVIHAAEMVSPAAGWAAFGAFCLFIAAWPNLRRS